MNPAVGVQPPRIKDEPLSVTQPKRDWATELAKVKRDAQTLAELAQTIPPGIDQAQKGVLPKDLLENLKRIEKLSRHIRHQLSP
jgi:predicted nucleic acid-binding Zn ribbon protein